MSTKYTDKDFIKILQKKANELGRTPKRREVKQNYAIKNHFGSWNNGLVAAGLKPLKTFGTENDEYKKLILEWAKKNGRTPRNQDFYDDPYLPDPRTMERKLDKTWTEIMIELELEPNQSRIDREYSDEELLDIFKTEYFKNKPEIKPDYDKLRTWGSPSLNYIMNRLKVNWNELLVEIGVSEQDLTIYAYTKDYLIKKIKQIAADLGYTPSIPELENLDYPFAALKDHFQNYNNALQFAGLELNQKTPDTVTETNEELLEMYKSFSEKIGKVASTTDLNNSEEIYNADVFTIRFGSMTDLKIKAGYSPKIPNRKYTTEQISRLLKLEYIKMGRKPTTKEINLNKSLPTVTTILRYFRTTSIEKVWKQIL